MVRATTLSVLLGLALMAPQTWAQSVLPNGSVEDGTGSTPDYFYREGPSEALTWATDHARTGDRSIKAQSGWPGEAWWVSNAFPVDPGAHYRISMWVWQENVNTNPSDDDYRWAMVIRFGTSQASGHLSGIIAPDHYAWLDQSVSNAGWYEVVIELQAPANAHYADWDLRKRHLASGQVWIDDIEAIPLGDALVPGNLSAVGIVDAISARMTYTGDDNQNGTAELFISPTGQQNWTSQGLMNRVDGTFRLNTGELTDQTYDVRVLLDDPDGIDGDPEHIVTGVEPADEGDVSLVDWSSTSAELINSGYTIYWDETETGDQLYISLPGADRHLMTQLNGFGLDLMTGAISFTVVEEATVYNLTWVKDHDWGTTTTELIIPFVPGWLFWTVTATDVSGADFSTSTWPLQFAEDGTPTSTPVTVHSVQQPYGTPSVLIEDTEAIQGTASYFEYLTVLDPWFNLADEFPVQGVGGNENGFGFRPPLAGVPVSTNEVILAKSEVNLQPGYPVDEIEVAERYSTSLAVHIGSPWMWNDPLMLPWDQIAELTIDNLLDTDDCWTTVGQQPMLRAYVGAPRPGEAEAIAQLDVLVALTAWLQYNDDPDGEQLASTLTATLPYFWNNEHQTFVNNAPNTGISGGDSWYTIQLHCDLARLMLMGNTTARDLLFDSIPAVIAFARNVDYQFPVFFEYGTWEPISGSEPDVPGAYAWLMLAMWYYSGNDMYFDEAEAAIQALRGTGMDMTYEMHMTAASTAACAKLYDITEDQEYLDLLNLSLGNLLRHVWLYESDFGYAADYNVMCGFNAMHTINYIAAKEQHEVYRYLREAYEVAGDALDPALSDLLARILDRMGEPVWFALPPHIPEAMISDNPIIGYNALDLYIPLEDLRDGAQLSGQIGQELYGTGAVFTFAGGYVSVPDRPVRGDRADETTVLPGVPTLLPVYPNPANPAVTMQILVPAGWQATDLHLEISNVLGRRVADLSLRSAGSGMQTVTWQATGHASGTYFARLVWTGGTGAPQRLTVLR